MEDGIYNFIIQSIINGSLDDFIISIIRENMITGLLGYFILKRLARDTDWAPNNQIFEMILGLISKRKRQTQTQDIKNKSNKSNTGQIITG